VRRAPPPSALPPKAIDILRRDLLTPRHHVRSRLIDMTGPVVVPAQRTGTDPGPEPVTDSPAWPEIAPGESRS
jgi:hypothetical protein